MVSCKRSSMVWLDRWLWKDAVGPAFVCSFRRSLFFARLQIALHLWRPERLMQRSAMIGVNSLDVQALITRLWFLCIASSMMCSCEGCNSHPCSHGKSGTLRRSAFTNVSWNWTWKSLQDPSISIAIVFSSGVLSLTCCWTPRIAVTSWGHALQQCNMATECILHRNWVRDMPMSMWLYITVSTFQAWLVISWPWGLHRWLRISCNTQGRHINVWIPCIERLDLAESYAIHRQRHATHQPYEISLS